jgi:hypothetical protein
MSTLLWSLAKENPWPGLAVASLDLVVTLSFVGLSLLLGVTIILVARLHAFVDREAVPIKRQAQRRRAHSMTSALLARDCIIYSVNVWLASDRTADERSWIAFKGLQRGAGRCE